jgi:hypothetical protein
LHQSTINFFANHPRGQLPRLPSGYATDLLGSTLTNARRLPSGESTVLKEGDNIHGERGARAYIRD